MTLHCGASSLYLHWTYLKQGTQSSSSQSWQSLSAGSFSHATQAFHPGWKPIHVCFALWPLLCEFVQQLPQKFSPQSSCKVYIMRDDGVSSMLTLPCMGQCAHVFHFTW